MNGLRIIISFILLVILTVRGFSQDCSITSKANDIIPDKLCAPVTVDWEVTYRGVDDGGTGDVYFEFDWNDGNLPQQVLAINSNPATGEWTYTHNHVYPIGGDLCNYHPTVTLIVAGVPCSSSIQEQIVTVWDTDDLNGGEMIINPQVFPICVGNDGTVTFVDVSQWNCTPPDENDVINDRNRWVQWIYGTNSADPDFIVGAEVDGSVLAYPYTGAIDYVPGPVEGPVSPYNTAKPVYIPNGYDVGDWFEITLRNWNACNPYDDPTIPGPPVDFVNGDYPPVVTQAIAIIVDYPDATITPEGPFCDNESSVTLNAATNGGVWSGVGIVNATTGEFDPGNAGSGSHTITYTVTNSSGCVGTDTEVIQVYDSPKVSLNVGPVTYLCPGILQILDGNPTGGTLPYDHTWTGDTDSLTATDIQNPDFRSSKIGVYNFTYEVEDDNGCVDRSDISIEVDTVNIYFERPYVNICAGQTSVIDPGPAGGSGVFAQHIWTGDSIHLLTATDVETPLMTATVPGVYTFYYYVKSDQGCDASDSVFVQVLEMPDVEAGVNADVCGYKYGFDATITGGTGEWEQVEGPGHTVFANVNDPKTLIQVDMYGTYEYRWMADNMGCADSSFVTINFYEVPMPVVMDDKDTCALASELVVYPHIGVGEWNVVSSPIGANILIDNKDTSATSFIADLSGIYEFAWVENNNGCIGGDTVQVEFYPIPEALLEPFDVNGCNEYAIEFENNTTNADNYMWDFGDGFISNQEEPVHTFENLNQDVRSFHVSMIASNVYQCKDTLEYDIDVAPSPDARFVPDVSVGCTPLDVNFINQSSGATSYKWDFGDTTSISNLTSPSYQYLNGETYYQGYEVVLVAENDYSCTDTARSYITVYPALEINLKATPQEGCNPLRVVYEADPGAYSYKWNFGDGDEMEASSVISHIYESTSDNVEFFDVELQTSSVFGCLDTSRSQIEVKPTPTANFEPSVSEDCSPFIAQFENMSSEDVTKSFWKFDVGDVSEMPFKGNAVYEYVNDSYAPAWKTVRLLVENGYGCVDSIERNLQVFPDVGAAISSVEPGCSPYMAIIQNATTGGRSFEWDYGDGATSAGYMGNHQFEYNGDAMRDFEVQMIATSMYGCKDTASTIVTIYPTPDADFIPDPESQQMPDATFTFINNTFGTGWTYKWDFGDGSISSEEDPIHEYNVSGTYVIKLNVYGAMCEDSIQKAVTIVPMQPYLDYGPDTAGCPPLVVEFYNNSIDATEYLWEFGDGESSALKDPVHVYHTAGEYAVKLTAYGPGGISEGNDVKVTVYETPVASFSLAPEVVTLPGEPVVFTDESLGEIVSWKWNFGDEAESASQNPVHQYTDEGLFDVTLEVTNIDGCQNNYTKTEAVKTRPGGEIKYPNAFTPNPAGPNGGYYDDVTVRQGNHVFYPFTEEGIVEYKLQIFTRWGEIIFESQDVNIGWDGYLRGKICEQGVYIYKATIKFSNGSSKVYTGDVTLIR